MGNLHEVTEAKCALVEEHEDEVTKRIEQNASLVIIQTPKVAPEPEPEAEPAPGEKGEKEAHNHVNEPADLEDGNKVDELEAETKEENGKKEAKKIEEITEKINGVAIKKEDESGKEVDAAKEEPDTDEKKGDEEVKVKDKAKGN